MSLNSEENKETKGVDEMSEAKIVEGEYISVKEAADLYGCSYPNMYAHVKKGSLQSYKVNGKTALLRADVVDFKPARGRRKVAAKAAPAKAPEVAKPKPTEVKKAPEEVKKTSEVEAGPPVPELVIAKPSVPEEVVLGMELILTGEVRIKEPQDEIYIVKEIDDITASVVNRYPTEGGGVWIICQPEGSDVYLAVLEHEILQGKYTVVTEEHKQGLLDVEKEKEHKVFCTALTSFTAARDAKLKAEKELKVVGKVDRPVLEGYTRKYGQESEEGKQDFLISEAGHDVHLVRTPGKALVTYKEIEILKWLLANGHEDCIKQAVDIEMWKDLKASGKVPADVISSSEDMSISKDKFALIIKTSR